MRELVSVGNYVSYFIRTNFLNMVYIPTFGNNFGKNTIYNDVFTILETDDFFLFKIYAIPAPIKNNSTENNCMLVSQHKRAGATMCHAANRKKRKMMGS